MPPPLYFTPPPSIVDHHAWPERGIESQRTVTLSHGGGGRTGNFTDSMCTGAKRRTRSSKCAPEQLAERDPMVAGRSPGVFKGAHDGRGMSFNREFKSLREYGIRVILHENPD